MIVRSATLVLLIAGLLGCATHQVPLQWDTDGLTAAAQRVSQEGEGSVGERTLFEAGLAHALPQSPLYDPALARARFDRLLELFPRTPNRPVVHYLIPLLDEAREQEHRARERDRDVEGLQVEIEELKGRVERLELLHEQQSLRAVANQQLVETLENELRVRNARIRELEEQLQQLMKVDLNPSS